MSRAINTITAATAADGAANLNIDSGTLFIDTTNNNVGIGTTSPSDILHVSKANGVSIFESTGISSVGIRLRTNSTDRWQIGCPSASADLAIHTGAAATERLRIDSNGRVGIGTTSPLKELQINATEPTIRLEESGAGSKRLELSVNSAAEAKIFANQSGGTLILGTVGSERLRIDSSGKMLSNGASNTYGGTGSLSLNAPTGSAVDLELRVNNTLVGYLYNDSTNVQLANAQAGYLSMLTNNTERLRITSGGYLKASVNGSYQSTASYHEISSNTASSYIIYFSHTGTNPYGIYQNWTNDPNNLTSTFIECRGNSTPRIMIYSNGNIQNTNNSYGAISDIKLKENITNASSQWNDVKALQVRKFSFKDDQEHKLMLGLVAQEVELVSPNLVETVNDKDSEGNDLGTTTKGVKYSILYMKAVKALQEAMERIEQLESKVAALEAT